MATKIRLMPCSPIISQMTFKSFITKLTNNGLTGVRIGAKFIPIWRSTLRIECPINSKGTADMPSPHHKISFFSTLLYSVYTEFGILPDFTNRVSRKAPLTPYLIPYAVCANVHTDLVPYPFLFGILEKNNLLLKIPPIVPQ